MRHTLFISDLHLAPNRPDITQGFFNFLAHQAPLADALYILGDLFEVWIGDDETSAFHQSVIAGIKQLTSRGLSVYVMRGNRDFLMGETFFRATGCQFLPDPTVITLYGNNIGLTHGDTLCTWDSQHQRFRKYAQDPRYHRFFLHLPLCIRRAIARAIRQASQKHTAHTANYIMDVAQEAVEKRMREQHIHQLIHGHTHRPAVHTFLLGDTPAFRIVLSDWHTQGGALFYPENGAFELIPIIF